MHRLTVTLMLLFITFALHSQRKEKYPRAEIKVEYNYYKFFCAEVTASWKETSHLFCS